MCNLGTPKRGGGGGHQMEPIGFSNLKLEALKQSY